MVSRWLPTKCQPMPPRLTGLRNDVLARAVVIMRVVVAGFLLVVAQVDQVKVRGGDAVGLIPEITGDGQGF